MISGINIFGGSHSVRPQATNSTPDAGGEAPSVDATTRIAVAAASGSIPTDTKIAWEITPIDVSVAVEDRGPATTATRINMITTVATFDRLMEFKICTISSERPSLLIILLAAKTNIKRPPVLEK